MRTQPTLLAATDFSDDARNAVERAALLAAQQRARLTLLHVLSGTSLGIVRSLFRVPDEAEATLVANARRTLDELAAEIAAKAAGAPATRVRVGRVVDEVLAASRRADLLVLGARGWNPVRDTILGTTAERLLHRCRRPVLVVKRAAHGGYRQVLVPVDFSPCSVTALQTALRIAPAAQVTVVHAWNVPFEGRLWLGGVDQEQVRRYRVQAHQQALTGIDRLLQATGGAARCARMVVRGAAASIVLGEEIERDADLIVIGRHSRSKIEDTVLGSVTRHVLSGARCDVLVASEAAPVDRTAAH